MKLLGEKTLTVNRYTVTLTDGFLLPTLDSTFTATGALQPLQERDLLALDEGQRTRARFAFYVPEDTPSIRTVDTDAETPADMVVHNGVEHEVIVVGEWHEGMKLDHTRYVLLEPESPAELS